MGRLTGRSCLSTGTYCADGWFGVSLNLLEFVRFFWGLDGLFCFLLRNR